MLLIARTDLENWKKAEKVCRQHINDGSQETVLEYCEQHYIPRQLFTTEKELKDNRIPCTIIGLEDVLMRKMYTYFVGKTYEDPDGIWLVVGQTKTECNIECIQDENINQGKRFVVPIEEVSHYMGVGVYV